MVSLTCLKEGEEAAVAFDSDGASSNYGLDIKDHLPSHVNEATNKVNYCCFQPVLASCPLRDGNWDRSRN